MSGRKALITGATGHLGQVISDTLAELGAGLILVDQDEDKLARFSQALKADWGAEVDYRVCNLEDEECRKKLISSLVNNQQLRLNILVNNAAFVGDSELVGWATAFEHQTISTWRRAIEVNLTAVFHLTQNLMPNLVLAQDPTIINIASIYGQYGPDWSLYEGTGMSNPAAYSVSKGGVIQLTKWLATTVAPGVRVNAISPGGIFRNQSEKFVRRYEKRTPLGRMAVEDDFRGAIAFLATNLSKYVTGQNIEVDGGWGVW